MDSIIDTNLESQLMRPKRTETPARLTGLEQFVRLGKRGIISAMAAEGQVCQRFAAAVFLGIFCGCLPSTPVKTAVTQVTGASMSPTIWGEFVKISCPGCAMRWQANWQPELRPQHSFPCGNCGFFINPPNTNPPSTSEPADSLNSPFFEYGLGDYVTIDGNAYRNASPQINDLVAIGSGDQIRIKRIVGTTGDVISSDHGVLLRNQELIATDAPWMLVHDDRYRREGKSWWSFHKTMGANAIKQTEHGFRIMLPHSAPQPPSAWLIYQHRSPYNGLRPDRVGDDYLGNLNESRPLRPIESLGLHLVAQVKKDAIIRFWLWKSSGDLCHEQAYAPGDYELRIRWEKAKQDQPIKKLDAMSFDAYRPIAIEVVEGELTLRDLKIERPIIHTIEETNNDSIQLPLKLLHDQFFVVGDNVPLSIDSRQQGPVHRSEIVGRVIMPSNER
jgi:signal peptidase I